jgi:hypothetical protein
MTSSSFMKIFYTLIITLFVCSHSHADTVIQKIDMSKATFDGLVKTIKWKPEIIMAGCNGSIQVQAQTSDGRHISMPKKDKMEFDLPKGFMDGEIKDLKSNSMALELGEESFKILLNFDEPGKIGNPVIDFDLEKCGLEIELKPSPKKDGTSVFAPIKTELHGTVSNPKPEFVGAPFLSVAQSQFDDLGNITTNSKIKDYFKLKDTQEGIYQVLLYCAQAVLPGPWNPKNEIVKGSVKIQKSHLIYDVLIYDVPSK